MKINLSPQSNCATFSQNTWDIVSTPVLFECVYDSQKDSFPSGWVVIKAHLNRYCTDYEANITVILKNGKKLFYGLPVTLKGKVFEIVYFPKNIQAVYLSPMGSVGRLQVDNLTFTKISWFKRNYLMSRRIYHVFKSKHEEAVYKAGLRWYLPFINLPKAYEIASHFRSYSPRISYSDWICSFDELDQHDKTKISKKIKKSKALPFLEVVYLGAKNTEGFIEFEGRLRKEQFYQNFKVVNKGEYSYEHFQAIESKWIVFVEPNAILRPQALYWIAYKIERNPTAALIYSDHDCIDEEGVRFSPNFKPHWSPEYFYSNNYIGQVIATQSTLIDFKQLKEWRVYELVLCLMNKTAWLNKKGLPVVHIPAVLYHLVSPVEENNLPVLQRYFEKNAVDADVSEIGYENALKVKYKPKTDSLISIVIPTRDMLVHLERCIESILNKTTYSNYEIIVVDNQSVETETIDYLNKIENYANVKVISYNQPFNYSSINNYAVKHARGEVLCLLNNDTEVISADWLEVMLGQLQQPNVGAVGVKLLFANGKVQHAGDAVGPGGCADHFCSGLNEDEPGYMGRAILAQDLSAVTAACLLTHRDLFDELDGLDEKHLSVAFNDVDYCLRVREKGKRVVFTPYAKLYHHESVSRGKDDSPEKQLRAKQEADYIRKRWGELMKNDPFYNANLNYSRPDFELSRYPLVKKPWLKR